MANILIRLSVFLIIIIYYPFSYASNWKITPGFTFSETYSDNINLAPSNQKGAFVTELSPSVLIKRETGRSRFNLDYKMQNLQNPGGNNKLDIFHQLQADSNLEVVRNSLFLDVNGSIDQQNVTNFNSSNDNLSGSRNRTNVSTYGISPYWQPHLNGYAEGEVRFNYTKFMTDSNNFSNSENFNYSVNLRSGRRFSGITWFVNYDKRDQIRENGDDVKFSDALFELRGKINRNYSFFTRVGHSKNSFQSTTNKSSNGLFYAIGAEWKPSERFSLEAAIGNNSFVTINLMPTRHMNWVTTFSKNDKGTNIGEVWQTSFDFKTKRSTWKASYEETTTTLQNEISNIQNSTVANTSLPTLQNQAIITKTGELYFSYRTGKSNVFTRIFSNRTIFQVSQEINNVIGINGSWDWSFTRRSSFFIRPSWQQTTRDNSKDHRYNISSGLNRRIPISIGRRGELNVKIEYQYINQTSDIQTNQFTENRITANLILSY